MIQTGRTADLVSSTHALLLPLEDPLWEMLPRIGMVRHRRAVVRQNAPKYANGYLNLSGRIAWSLDGRPLDTRPGTLFFNVQGQSMQAVAERGSSYLWWNLTGPRAAAVLERFGITSGHEVFGDAPPGLKPWLESLFRSYGASEGGGPAEAAASFWSFFARLRRDRPVAAPARDDLARQAGRLLMDHLEEGVSLDFLRRHLKVSEATLRRRFAEEYGRSPMAWLLDRRFDRACQLLGEGRLPVAEVGLRCGFESPQSFSRFFTARAGRPPGAWRAGG